MKVTYFDQKQDYNLSVDFSKMMSSGWTRRFKDFFHSEDMREAMFTTTKMYKGDHLVFPKKQELFAIFNKLDVTEINVVIVNCHPRFTEKGNGIAFANRQNAEMQYDRQLTTLLDEISMKEHRRLFPSDVTLEHWIDQYVFPLNVALTGFADLTQKALWFGLIRTALQTISKARQGVIFQFIGTEAQCRPYIDLIDHKKHTVLQSDILNYDALNDINLEIDGINGKEYRIRW